ncbi:hypothetical protein HK096_009493 [Nowakowskiella sp. JEL0078]|nr:hypothetical protein HK096_009493 [Nowakowskiella sp. JEL0078]
MRHLLFALVTFIVLQQVSSSCSDLGGRTFSITRCYESVSCLTLKSLTTGSFCKTFGGGSFSFTSTYYDCSPLPTSTAYSTVSSCTFTFFPNNFCSVSKGSGFATATVSRALYPSYTDLKCYGTAAIMLQDIVSFRTGVVAGVTAGVIVNSSATNSPTSNSGSNRIVVIIAVACSVVVVIIAILGVVIFRKMRVKRGYEATPSSMVHLETSAVSSSNISGYPQPSPLGYSAPGSEYMSGVPTGYPSSSPSGYSTPYYPPPSSPPPGPLPAIPGNATTSSFSKPAFVQYDPSLHYDQTPAHLNPINQTQTYQPILGQTISKPAEIWHYPIWFWQVTIGLKRLFDKNLHQNTKFRQVHQLCRTKK